MRKTPTIRLGPSEQVYGHSAGACRALPLGVVRREWPHPWQVRLDSEIGCRPGSLAVSKSGHILVQRVPSKLWVREPAG